MNRRRFLASLFAASLAPLLAWPKLRAKSVPLGQGPFYIDADFAESDLTDAYLRELFEKSGCVNDAEFYGRAPGTCLFRGASGRREGGTIPVVYSFEVSDRRCVHDRPADFSTLI
jgi:hypothetical protein